VSNFSISSAAARKLPEAMLAAHLAFATLTVAPVSQNTTPAPYITAAQALSAEPKVVAPPALPETAATPVPESAPVSSPATSELVSPVTTRAQPEPSASLDDIDLAAPKAFPDPLEPINRISYAISQPIDRFILRPAAMVYKAVVPKPARDGARNAISNFGEPIVFINDVVQLRPKRAIRTLGRFLINSVLGLGGIFDIAKRKPFNIKHHNNGFSDTLGYLGIGPLFYIYVPVLGPTNFRDMIGQYGDSYFWDRNLHKLIHPNGRSNYFRTQPRLGKSSTIISVISGLDQRAENDEDLKAITQDSVDPYAALRANYLQDRAGEIAELKASDGVAPATQGFDDPLVDPATATTVSAPETTPQAAP
jgi:phospholipid-binding lipoprotein MlaA